MTVLVLGLLARWLDDVALSLGSQSATQPSLVISKFNLCCWPALNIFIHLMEFVPCLLNTGSKRRFFFCVWKKIT